MSRLLLLLTLTATPLFSHAIEEPRYEVNYGEHLGKLQAALAAASVATLCQPVLVRYNSPMTPWFMRRNEIWLALR